MIVRSLSGAMIRRLICTMILLNAVMITVSVTHGTALASPLVQQLSQNDVEIDLMQTGVGDTSDLVEDVLVFRVRAFDQGEGNDDGDGITYVDMIILDESGDEVYRKRETDPGYCAFGGGAPNCSVWDFGDNNNNWPDGDPLEQGEHTLRARARADDGEVRMQDFVVDIFLTDNSDNVRIDLVQTGVGDTSDLVEDVLVFRVRAFDQGEGNDDGDGITYVDMIILDESGDEVYRKRETDPGYCAFGGGAPNCSVWDFGDNNNNWPDGDPLEQGEHTLRARARADDGEVRMQDFVVDIFLTDNSDNVRIDLVQTGVGDTSDLVEDVLVFRVRAFDQGEGNDDGDGITYVDMIILDESGDEVYRKRETDPGYCAFGGGAPNCSVWDFGDNNNNWPDGDPLEQGEHTLRARARADDGEVRMQDFVVDIFLTDNSDNVRIDLVQTGVGDTSDLVEDVLVFRVRAFDQGEGNDDGDGITYVDMIILDESGDEVYRKRETDPGYCAFGGGAPNCSVWDFGDNNNNWPDGDPLEQGEHTLRARARADDGEVRMQDFVVDIFLTN